MRWTMAAVALVVWIAPAIAAEPKEEVVKVIDLKDVQLKAVEGRFGGPKEITSEADLAKIITDEKALASIKKQIDFKTHKAFFFAWSGSGQDKLSFAVEGDKKKEVVFSFSPGRTKDLRPHFHLFVVPKDVSIKMGGK